MEAPAWMFTKALSHRQKVCRLYKRALREVDAWYQPEFLEARYHKVILRARFDAYKDEKDIRKSQIVLVDGCRELWEKRHNRPFRFPQDPGGVSYNRDRDSADSLVDTEWQYVEREQFPYYYNKRELRKKELLKHWDKIEEDWDKELEAIQKEPAKSEAQKRQ